MEITLLVLVVGTLWIAARWRKKLVTGVLTLLWAVGIASYVYGSYEGQLAMHKAARRTTKAVVEVRSRVGDSIGVVQTAELTSKADLASLFDGLRLERNGVWTKRACACRGNPSVHLYDTTGQFATITIHHGKSIRCTLWSTCNVDIRQDALPKLKAFMESLGVELGD